MRDARFAGPTIRNSILFAAIGAVWLVGAALAEIDLSDFDDDTMRAMDDAMKDLEPVIGGKSAIAAQTDAQTIQEGLKWTEAYFTKKGNFDDAVQIAKHGEDLVAEVQANVSKSDFDAAMTAARAVEKNCHACHDLYKPRK